MQAHLLTSNTSFCQTLSNSCLKKSLMKSLKAWNIIKFRVFQVIEVVCVNKHVTQLDQLKNSSVGLSVFALVAHSALKWSS